MAKAVRTLLKSKRIGIFMFEAVFSTDHSASVTLTQHPVQTGASISDHAYVNPDQVTIEIGMTDSAREIARGARGNSVNAYKTLRKIMEARQPLTLTTRLFNYKNMVITAISTTDDFTTMNALKASIVLSKANIVKVSTIRIQQTVSSSIAPDYHAADNTTTTGGKKPSKPTKTSAQQNTSANAEPANQSTLYGIFGRIGAPSAG